MRGSAAPAVSVVAVAARASCAEITPSRFTSMLSSLSVSVSGSTFLLGLVSLLGRCARILVRMTSLFVPGYSLRGRRGTVRASTEGSEGAQRGKQRRGGIEAVARC